MNYKFSKGGHCPPFPPRRTRRESITYYTKSFALSEGLETIRAEILGHDVQRWLNHPAKLASSNIATLGASKTGVPFVASLPYSFPRYASKS